MDHTKYKPVPMSEPCKVCGAKANEPCEIDLGNGRKQYTTGTAGRIHGPTKGEQ